MGKLKAKASALLVNSVLGGGIVADTTAPTCVITCAQTSPSNAAVFNYTITFSESVTGFVNADFTVAGGTKSNFAGSGAVYTCDVTPSALYVTVDVGAGVCVDGASNANTAAAQFTMLALSAAGIKFWIDFSDISTLYQDTAATTPVAANNDPIGKATDKSGQNNHLLQVGLNATRPLYKTAIQNSRAIARFDGSDDWLQSSAVALTTPWIVMIVNQQAWVINRNLFSEVSSGKEMQLYRQTATPRITMFETSNGPTSTELTVGAFHILETIWNGASSILRVDNNTDNTGNPGTHAMDGITLAAGLTGASVSQNDFGEIFIFSGYTPSANDRTALRNYLNAKWATF